MEETTHEWFVSGGTDLNKVIAQTTEGGDFNFETDLLKNVVCGDGKRRTLWQCSYELAVLLWDNRDMFKREIKIFSRAVGKAVKGRSNKGLIRDVTFLFSNKRRQTNAKF